MNKKYSLKRIFFVFMLILSLLFESTAPYISFADKLRSNNETIVEETISTSNINSTEKKANNSAVEKDIKIKNDFSGNIDSSKTPGKISNNTGLDGVTNNEKPDGTIQKGNFDTPIMIPRSARSRFRSVVPGVPEWVKSTIKPDSDLPNPGDVKVYAPIITEDSIIANKVTMKLLVSARDTVNTSNIVLVIDRSGSMAPYDGNGYIDRMKKAKEAANAFVDKVLGENPDGNTKIGIVSFAGDAKVESTFTNNKTQLKNSINSISAVGGTFTQAGVRQAREMLKSSTSNKKYMVVLSDGEPTFSYEIKNKESYTTEDVNNVLTTCEGYFPIYECQKGKCTNYNIQINDFLNTTVGSGRAMYHAYKWDKNGGNIFNPSYFYYMYNHGNSAIAEAGFAKNIDKIDGLYTVGLQTNSAGSSVLKKMASKEQDFYEVTDVNNLTPIFQIIAGNILKATNEAKVDIKFNDGFQLPKGVNISDINHSVGTSVKIENGAPKWEIGTVSTPLNEVQYPGVKFAWVEFPITVNDDILKHDHPENGINPLGKVTLEYKDQNGKLQSKDFPEKQMKPKLYVLTKKVTDNSGGAASDSNLREFQIKVTKESDNSLHETITLRPGQSKILNNVEKGKKYKIYESSKAKVYQSDSQGAPFQEFDVSTYYNKYEVKDSVNSTTESAPNDGVGKAIVATIPSDENGSKTTATFTNVEADEARAIISIRKNLESESSPIGMMPTSIPSRNLRSANSASRDKEFKINLKRKKGVMPGHENEHNWTESVKAGETKTIAHKMRFTTYIVSENLDSALPYAPKQGEQGKEVKITLYDVLAGKDKGQIIDFTNVYDPSGTKEITATKKWKNGPESDHKAVTLNLYRQVSPNDQPELVNSISPEVTPNDGASHERFTYKWNVPTYNNSGKEYIYTVKESGTTEENGKIFVNINNNKYEVTQVDNVITNTYVQPKQSVTVTKIWKDDANKNIEKPNINLTLYRKIGTGSLEKVPINEADVKVVNGNTTIVKWENLKKTDESGEEYTFVVKESFKNTSINNDNWTIVEETIVENGKATITNTLKSSDELGKIAVSKELKNEYVIEVARSANGKAPAKDILKFKFKLTGVGGYSEEFELSPGEKKVFNGLYFGNYELKEIDAKGFVATYEIDSKMSNTGEIILKASQKNVAAKVINENTGSDELNVKPTLVKEWKGGTKPSTVVELWRKSESVAPEKVNEFKTIAGGEDTQSKKFTKVQNSEKLLAKYDTKGNLYEYYAVEPNVPANYKKTEEGLKVINTYKKIDDQVKPDPKPDKDDRVDGDDRIETAVEISKKYFGKSDTVIIARSDLFPDSLTATVLSKLLDAPILLTQKDKLDARVKSEILRLGAKDIIIVGGHSSVSENVKKELEEIDKNGVERISGADRYSTSEQVARRVVGITGKKNRAVIASGEVFPDALSISSFAAREGYPILLVKKDFIPYSVSTVFDALDIKNTYVIGGRNAISYGVQQKLPNVYERIGGADRYETAVLIAKSKFKDSRRAFIASGEVFADALVIGPVAGKYDAPILLTGSKNAPKSVVEYIKNSLITRLTIVGGRKYIPEIIALELRKY